VQPLDVDGAIKCELRSFGLQVSDFFTPSTSVWRLIPIQSSIDPSLPCSEGICQWDGTSVIAASGNVSRISRPRAYCLTSGSRYIFWIESSLVMSFAICIVWKTNRTERLFWREYEFSESAPPQKQTIQRPADFKSERATNAAVVGVEEVAQ